MIPRALLRRIVIAVGGLTVLSGAVQLVWPQLVLTMVGGSITPTSAHVFRVVGMFMVLFGGLALQTVLSGEDSPSALLWATLQKFGASAAVGWGVAIGVFSAPALGVAGFDLLSGILLSLYIRSPRA
jgi:hypothetical protein